MALTILTTVPTTQPPAPGQPAAGVDQCFFGSPTRLVLDATVSEGATLHLYRWDADLLTWIPSAAPATVLSGAGAAELRYDTASVIGYYALVREAGSGTGTYSVLEGR